MLRVLVLVHIQQHLDEALELNDLAGLAHFSPYHFHRVFQGMVGETLMAHVRRMAAEAGAGDAWRAVAGVLQERPEPHAAPGRPGPLACSANSNHTSHRTAPCLMVLRTAIILGVVRFEFQLRVALTQWLRADEEALGPGAPERGGTIERRKYPTADLAPPRQSSGPPSYWP